MIKVVGIRMTGMNEHQLPDDINGTQDSTDMLQQKYIREVKRLSRFSIRGIQALMLYLVVCALAWRGFLFLPDPDTITTFLGTTPSARIISNALMLYTFSAIILTLSRMTAGIEHRSSFCHVGFLTAFYLFYYCGKALEDNYWAVFGAGITILGVESYRIWSYCTEAVSRIREDIEYVTRTGRPPPGE